MTDDDEKPRWFVTRQTVKEVFAEGVPLHFINADTLSAFGRPISIDDAVTPDTVLVCTPLIGPLPVGRILAACDACARPIMVMATAPTNLQRVCLVCAKRRGAFKT